MKSATEWLKENNPALFKKLQQVRKRGEVCEVMELYALQCLEEVFKEEKK